MTPRSASDLSLAARQRVATGRAFEADVDITARRWEHEKIGKIWRHAPTFVKVKGTWRPQRGGGGHVDRTGHVCCGDAGNIFDCGLPHDHSGHVHCCGGAGNIFDFDFTKVKYASRGDGNLRLWEGRTARDTTHFVIPVAFDCKVLAKDAVTYRHDPDRLHQLVSLKDAASAGVYAFLLVYAPKNNAVFALPIEKWYGQLLGEGVTLIRRGVPTMTHMVKETIGCDFIRLLPLCMPNCLRR